MPDETCPKCRAIVDSLYQSNSIHYHFRCGSIQFRLTGEFRQSDTCRIAELKAALPDPDKLDLLADWLDLKDAQEGRDGVEIQLDLRRWARLVREARHE